MKDEMMRLPEGLREALKKCDLLVGPETVEYYYQLYDPKTGGFYYSISSRDSEEMTPFAEGTRFVIEGLRNGGIELPEWWQKKVAAWIKGHQDPSDGFFYEDLWGKITYGARLYRDLNYSVDILKHWCNDKPLYTLPAERIKAGEEVETVPARLKDKKVMLEYLESLDWSTAGIWSTGQKLSTEAGLMVAAGIYDFVYDYVIEKQDKSTGLWGESLEWMATNGGMKLSGFLARSNKPYPNMDKMIDSVLEIFGQGVPAASATHIWNPFVLLNNALRSQKEDAERMRRKLYESGADIVNFAVDCALQLKRKDGGFASSRTRAINRQQGYLFGHGLADESDMDGTAIAGQRLRQTIHNVFDAECSRDYYAPFAEEFCERIRVKPEIVKTLPRPEGPLDPAWRKRY